MIKAILALITFPLSRFFCSFCASLHALVQIHTFLKFLSDFRFYGFISNSMKRLLFTISHHTKHPELGTNFLYLFKCKSELNQNYCYFRFRFKDIIVKIRCHHLTMNLWKINPTWLFCSVVKLLVVSGLLIPLCQACVLTSSPSLRRTNKDRKQSYGFRLKPP